MDDTCCHLTSLPYELIVYVVLWLPALGDVVSLDCTARLFHFGKPRSAVEDGLRLRAYVAGQTVATVLPAGETSWSQWLLWGELLRLVSAGSVVSSGEVHSAFVDAYGKLLTSGKDVDGTGGSSVLGQGIGVVESVVPRSVAGLGSVNICTVAAGLYHTLVCSDTGVAYSFGIGSHGQLGHGNTANCPTPRAIKTWPDVHFSGVAAGSEHSLLLSSQGALYSFGKGVSGQLGHGNALTQDTPQLVATLQGGRTLTVAAGGEHSLVLSYTGKVYSCGRGKHGRLGHGNMGNQLTPRCIAFLQDIHMCGVAAAAAHSFVVSSAGRLYSFGRDWSGLLGHGDRGYPWCLLVPRLVAALEGLHISAVATGLFHSLVLNKAGEVYSFGGGYYGQLGNGIPTNRGAPHIIAGLLGVHIHSISAGIYTSLAVTTNGELYGWGFGRRGIRPHAVLGLEIVDHQYVPLKYPDLHILF